MTTTNLAEFGRREISIAGQILTAYADCKEICPYFTNDGVRLMMNTNSGNVFLTDEDYNVLMMNGSKLEGFYSTPYAGHEGFFEDLLNDWNENWHEEDSEYLARLAKDWNREEELPEQIKNLV